MGDYNNYVFNQLSELFPQVNHRILKTVSFNHQYNLNAAIEVIMDNFVFEQLKDVFPLVDDEILKAIADEHSDNAEVAVNEILHEVVPYMPSYIGGSDGADVLESAVQSEADEMKQVKQLVGSTPEEAKVGEDSTYFDDPSENTLLADSSVSRSLGVNEEPMLEDYVSVSREMCEKLEKMAEDATKNKEEKPIVEFQKDEDQDGEEEGDIDSKAIVKQDISEELLNVSKVLQEEVQEHSKMIQVFPLKNSPMVVKEMESLAPEESDEKLDDKELLSQRPALSNKSRKLGSLSSLQDSTASIKVPEEIETPSPICWSPIGGTKENVIDDDHQKLHEDDWEFIGHSDAE